jgi:transcriptional regulator with XRE-family HTH domain
MLLGTKLKKYRLDRKLTLRELAKEIGVPHQALGYIEQEDIISSIKTLSDKSDNSNRPKKQPIIIDVDKSTFDKWVEDINQH